MGFRYQFLKGKLPENSAYGHSSILTDYCGLDSAEPIFGRIQHGWGEGSYWDDDRIPSFVWSNRIYQNAIGKEFKDYICIGAPFIYLDENWESISENRNHSLLVIPHSAFNHRERYSLEEFKKLLTEMMGMANYNVKLLFYWKDLTLEIQQYCVVQNIEIASAGDGIFGTDKDHFLLRIQKFIGQSKEVILGEIGSLFFYSAYMDKQIKLLKPTGSDIEKMSEFKKFIYTNSLDDREIREICANEVGKNYKKSPEELTNIIGNSSSLEILRKRKEFVAKSFASMSKKIKI
jgi:hypothetical protein